MLAAERLAGTVELLEMVLLALPLRSLILARQVSQTCLALIDRSEMLKKIRETPFVTAKLALPFECSVSSPEHPMLQVDLVLHYDRPVTLRRERGPLDSPQRIAYRYGEDAPDTPRWIKSSLYKQLLRDNFPLSRKHEEVYITLLPGTAFRLTYDFGVHRWEPPVAHLPPLDRGVTGLDIGRTYVLKIRPDQFLLAYEGTKRSLLERSDAGDDLEAYCFHGSTTIFSWYAA